MQTTEMIDLQGLANRIMAPREIVRDKDGFLMHPQIPVCDEGVRADQFLIAFGIQTFFRAMDGDCSPELDKTYFEDGVPDCSSWTPTPPPGDGWALLEIYDTEDGPIAMFGRKESA